jgi:hypothetical protein
LTLSAIQDFQSSQLGSADGLIEPGKKTIAELEAQVSDFFPEIKAVTTLATVIFFEPAQVEPQPEDDPAINDAELQSFIQAISEA